MDAKVNQKLLDEKLVALEKARTWSPRTVSRLENLINTADDAHLFRINPIKFSHEYNLTEEEAIELFLHGSYLGLFQMEWQLLCPLCSCVVKSFGALKSVDNHYHCTLCQTNYEAALDDYIEISFTISSQVRDTRFHHPETLTAQDYVMKYLFCEEGLMSDGTPYVEKVLSISRGTHYLLPKEKVSIEVDAHPDFPLLVLNTGSDAQYLATVTGEPKNDPQHVPLNFTFDKFEPANGSVAPGKVMFEVENISEQKGVIGVFELPPGFKREQLTFVSFLSAKRLLNTQLFRDLFFSETIQATEGIGVKDLTILFTDLKGSTALYQRIGDLKAFSMVRRHFSTLGKVIKQNGGAIVKTIGDAVMATFNEPASATKAALELLKEVEVLNKSLDEKAIILKIGIHKGHCVAVTLNERIDYFGHAVNLAARVQNLADADEIYITKDVYDVPGVKEIIGDLPITSGNLPVKGVQGGVNIFRITQPGEHMTYFEG